MIDIKLIRENPALIQAELKARGMDLSMERLTQLDPRRREFQTQIDGLRAQQNAANQAIAAATGAEKTTQVAAMKDIATKVKQLEVEQEATERDFHQMYLTLPNFHHESVPVGSDESANQVVKTMGKKPTLANPKPHYAIPAIAPLIDLERGAKVSGSRFWYLKGELVELEFALIRYTLDFYKKKGYLPMRPPALVRREAMEGTGFFPADANEIYVVEGESDEAGSNQLYLSGTAEVPLAAYHSGETLRTKDLPIKYIGFAPAYRREAGTYGKDIKGILRGHEFDKLELFVFADPATSWKQHEQMQADAEEFWSSLGIPFQVLLMCTADIGAPNAKKYDTEAWMPGEGKYREVGSNSHDTDFQARRLKIRYGSGEKSEGLVHTLNNTACAIGRAIIAITENYQREDGTVDMPEALHPYLSFKRIELPKES